MDQECDEIDISPQDYTILLSNIPIVYEAENDDYDDDLKNFIENSPLNIQD